MTFFWIVLIIIGVVWLLSTRTAKKGAGVNISINKTEMEDNNISEETVFKSQSKFEKKIEEKRDLPDGVSHAEVYIYRNLMRPWFTKLSSENRYKEEMLQKLRNDWLDYMSSIEDRNTYNYLSNEFYDEKDNSKSEAYDEKHVIASRKAFAIEDGFAAAVGEDAVAELKRIHSMDYDSFSKSGELAPDGFRFDIRGELKPIEA